MNALISSFIDRALPSSLNIWITNWVVSSSHSMTPDFMPHCIPITIQMFRLILLCFSLFRSHPVSNFQNADNRIYSRIHAHSFKRQIKADARATHKKNCGIGTFWCGFHWLIYWKVVNGINGSWSLNWVSIRHIHHTHKINGNFISSQYWRNHWMGALCEIGWRKKSPLLAISKKFYTTR